MEAFDVILKGPLSDYLNISRAIGSEVGKHVSVPLSCENPDDRREEFNKMLIESQVGFSYDSAFRETNCMSSALSNCGSAI